MPNHFRLSTLLRFYQQYKNVQFCIARTEFKKILLLTQFYSCGRMYLSFYKKLQNLFNENYNNNGNCHIVHIFKCKGTNKKP